MFTFYQGIFCSLPHHSSHWTKHLFTGTKLKVEIYLRDDALTGFKFIEMA
jgi:hypothetical protein